MPVTEIASSTEHVSVHARNSVLQTLIWFKTQPLDRTFCANVRQLQLRTDSHDQGWVSSPELASWSWFEIVILVDAKATKPVIRDGKELAWFSHSNRMDAGSTRDWQHFGIIFDRGHDLLSKLQAGDIIAVRVCAQYPAWVNYAQAGNLLANVLNADLPFPAWWSLSDADSASDSVKDGVYTVPSSTEFRVASTNDEVASRIWFTTPIIDRGILKRIADVRLYTTAYGLGSTSRARGSSWIELVILGYPEDVNPRLKWTSHSIDTSNEGYQVRAGPLFDSRHDLLRSLKAGDVLGVRICASGPGWENRCLRGYLVVRLARIGQ